MPHLIDKDALVAELKKRFDYRVNGLKAIDNDTSWNEGQSEDEYNAVLTRCAYNAAKNEVFELMCFLDTLEVKEVNIEKQESDLPMWKKGGIAGGHWSGEAYVSQGRKPQLVYETMHIDVNELVKKLPKEDGV